MLASNKTKFLLKTLIISLIFIGIFSIKTFAIVNPTSNFYVNDYANLLNTETKNYIMNTNITLQNKTGAQIVVVTVPNLEGRSLEEYATELFRKFGIGDKNKNNGVLLLLALEERQFRVEVGYGLEGILPDGKTGRIQDEYIIPYLKQNDWDAGIKNGFSAILKEIEKEYSIDVGSEDAISTEYEDEDIDIPTMVMSLPPISVVVGVIIRSLSLKKNKKVIISTVYMGIVGVIYYISSKAIGASGSIINTIIFVIFNFVWFIIALFGRRLLWRTADFQVVVASPAVAEEASRAEEALLAVAEAQEVFKIIYINIYLKVISGKYPITYGGYIFFINT